MSNKTEQNSGNGTIEFLKVENEEEFPVWAQRSRVVDFFHNTMKPYEDESLDIERALNYTFSTVLIYN